MLYPGFIGSSNPTQSTLLNERLVNFYLEQSARAPEGAALYPTPGATPVVAVQDTGTRGLFTIDGRCWAVIGTGVYEIAYNATLDTWTATKRATVQEDTYPATFAYNPRATGVELAFTSGGNLYTMNTATNVVSAVAALAGEATMCGVLNNRYLVFDLDTGIVKISGLNNATFSELFTRSIAPDPWQTMLVGSREIWLIGETTGEVWYDSGATPQPFAPIPGAFFKHGIAAPFAAAIAGEQVVWLDKTEYGSGRIVAARGYSPQPISNYAVDTSIAAYARQASLTDTETLVYEQDGHLFAVFSFPDRGTWVVDLESGAWHERSTRNITEMRDDMWRPRVHCYAFNRHLVGDRSSGTISQLDVTVGTEADGSVIRRVRVAPPLFAKSMERLIVSRFDLMLDAGLGLASGQGEDPVVMMRVSQNGRSWGAERRTTAGRMGDYDHQAFFTRCGSSEKIWQPEIVVSDPIPWRLVGAQIEGIGIRAGRQAAA